MARIVIAGRSDCPYFARVELLGDSLVRNLPNFNLHKIVKKPCEWDSWLNDICTKNNWLHTKSPIIWRELIDRGGKGSLIGGVNDFQEYAKIYYGYTSKHDSHDVRTIANENDLTKTELDKESNYYRGLRKPMHVCITNAVGGACYGLINSLVCGRVFGAGVELTIHLLASNEDERSVVEGIRMESEDCARELVYDTVVTCDVYEAFCDCEVIVILDEVEMTEKDDKPSFYNKNAALFTRYAVAVGQVAKSNCKVVIAGGGPLNFNMAIFVQNCKGVSKQNVVGVARAVENSCKGVLGEYLKVNPVCVSDVIVWGNVNSNEGRYVDLNKISIHEYDGAIWGPPAFSLPLLEIVYDNKWVEGFPELINTHREKVEADMRHRMYMREAAAVSSLLYDWWNGCGERMSSMVVISHGWYGVPEGLLFSFPVRLHSEGYWCVVEDVDISEETQEKIKLCIQDLQDELSMHADPKAFRERLKDMEMAADLVEDASAGVSQDDSDGKQVASDVSIGTDGLQVKSSKEEISKVSSLAKIEEEKKVDVESSKEERVKESSQTEAKSQENTVHVPE